MSDSSNQQQVVAPTSLSADFLQALINKEDSRAYVHLYQCRRATDCGGQSRHDDDSTSAYNNDTNRANSTNDLIDQIFHEFARPRGRQQPPKINGSDTIGAEEESNTTNGTNHKRHEGLVDRSKVAEFFFSAVDYHNEDREIAHVAMNFVDRFLLSSRQQQTNLDCDMDLLVLVSLDLAIKLFSPTSGSYSRSICLQQRQKEEEGTNTLEKSPSYIGERFYTLMRLVGKEYSPEYAAHLSNMQTELISTLQFYLHPPTPNAFIRSFLDYAVSSSASPSSSSLMISTPGGHVSMDYVLEQIKEAAFYQVDLGLLMTSTSGSTTIRPSQLASAALLNAFQQVLWENPSTTTSISIVSPSRKSSSSRRNDQEDEPFLPCVTNKNMKRVIAMFYSRLENIITVLVPNTTTSSSSSSSIDTCSLYETQRKLFHLWKEHNQSMIRYDAFPTSQDHHHHQINGSQQQQTNNHATTVPSTYSSSSFMDPPQLEDDFSQDDTTTRTENRKSIPVSPTYSDQQEEDQDHHHNHDNDDDDDNASISSSTMSCTSMTTRLDSNEYCLDLNGYPVIHYEQSHHCEEEEDTRMTKRRKQQR